jgi:hypothetical protein
LFKLCGDGLAEDCWGKACENASDYQLFHWGKINDLRGLEKLLVIGGVPGEHSYCFV